MRKIHLILFGVLIITLFFSSVHADYSTVVSYDYEATIGNTLSDTNNMANPSFIYLYTDLVENLDNVVYQEIIEMGTNQFAGTAVTSSSFQGKISTTVVCTGLAIFSGSSDDKHDRLSLYFDYWDMGALTGNKLITLTYFDGVPASVVDQSSHAGYPPAGMVYGGPNGGLSAPVIHQTTVSTPYKTYFSVNNTDYPNIVKFNFNRVVDGVTYASLIDVRETDDNQSIFIENKYAVGGSGYAYIDKYPALVTVQFGYPTALDTIYYTIPGEDTNLIYEGSPLITPTATPTATPTPVPELCGYWSLAVNTSNILMNEYVQGTLTETDTSDRYDMIDWYRVMPSGQEVLALHYVYDPGLFGLGAGWFEVTPTGTAYASSLAEALENDIKFTTAGTHHLRAKIYDDVSILPMVYHDYNLVCSLEQVVYVGGTTQAINTLGINVKECDTNAMLPYVDISVYDYLTGQWINKTSEMISTTYFNVVPGHNVRILASKSGWLSSDTDYTIPASPGLYDVCLKRPLVDVVNESYVFFNVRDSVTLTGLFQANIQLSDGQIQNTLPSGYAGFSVNDGETYIYTVTKPGYQSFSNSFSITEDTTIPIKLVQISPTPTLTYPITTLPSVTITGTGTGVWSNTTATLSPADKTYKTTKGLDVWYNNIETLSGLLFVAAVFGAIGLISDSMSRRRRR